MAEHAGPRGSGAAGARPGGRRRRVPQAKCPVRAGEYCTACQPGTSGPEDCQLVLMVREDPELAEMMREMNAAHRKARREARTAGTARG
ncbi:DUF6767 domain-containing protein [Corynebacterium sp. 335C]